MDVVQLGTEPRRPSGWFRVAASDDVPPGAVRTVRLSGRDLVVFRTEDGALGATDPICPHLGAHLGFGGTVVGGALRCPFHGFRFAPDGRCVGTEHCETPPPRARLATWPVRDFAGQVFVFDAARPGPPAFELPSLDERAMSTPRYVTIPLEATVQDIAENGVDLAHFGAVHRYERLRDVAIRYDGPTIASRFRFDRRNPVSSALGKVTSVFDTVIHGLGCSVTELHVETFDLRMRLLLLATPVDVRRAEFTVGLSLRLPGPLGRAPQKARDAAAAPVVRYFMKHVLGDILQDREIWAHREPLPSPALAAEDAEIGRFRRWAAQFSA